MTIVTFITAFVTGAVLTRPKVKVPNPKEARIGELEAEVEELHERNRTLLETIVQERDERIRLLGQLGDAESAVCVWRLRAEQALALSGQAIFPPPIPANVQLQQQVRLGAQEIESMVNAFGMLDRRTPGERFLAICNCAPGRSEVLRRTLPRNQFSPDPRD